MLNGYIHNYQRFDQLNANGQTDPKGIREVIAGTGGKSLGPYASNPTQKPSVNLRLFGYLRLVLQVTGPTGMRLSSGSARGRNKCIENALCTGAQVCKLFGFEFGAEHLLARL